jgi:transposase-like protein
VEDVVAERVVHDEATKAAVMAALLTGQSINYVAKEYKIPRGTVASWSRELQRDHTVSYEKRERIGELIIDNVEAELRTMIAMQNVFTDEKWLKRQRASELAVLYGVIKDKNMRVLEALPNASDGPDSDDEA